jgi:hypothetical protein
VACGIFGLFTIASLYLPEICVCRSPDGATTVFYNIIVDAPTGDPTVSTVYSPWPLVSLFAATCVYYLVRAMRPNHGLHWTAR